MTQEEIGAHVSRWQRSREDRDWDALYDAFNKMIYKLALRYHKPDVEQLDVLIQEGRIGLLRAADTFDAGSGCRFSTHAFNHIQGTIRRHHRDSTGLIRRPSWIQSVQSRSDTESDRFYSEHGYLPDANVIASAISMKESQVRLAESTRHQPVSIARTIAGSGVTLGDTVVDPADPFNQVDMAIDLERAMATLTERERLVVGAIYGEQMSMEELIASGIAGSSKSTISSIHRSAICKLRSALGSDSVDAPIRGSKHRRFSRELKERIYREKVIDKMTYCDLVERYAIDESSLRRIVKEVQSGLSSKDLSHADSI